MTKDEYRMFDNHLRLIYGRIEKARRHILESNYGLALEVLSKNFPEIAFNVEEE